MPMSTHYDEDSETQSYKRTILEHVMAFFGFYSYKENHYNRTLIIRENVGLQQQVHILEDTIDRQKSNLVQYNSIIEWQKNMLKQFEAHHNQVSNTALAYDRLYKGSHTPTQRRKVRDNLIHQATTIIIEGSEESGSKTAIDLESEVNRGW